MGNDRRFASAYHENYGRVLRFIVRRIDPEAEAEDLAAEVFRLAWEHARQGHPVEPGWLFGTARNLLSNRYRARGRAEVAHRAVATRMRTDLAAQDATSRVRAVVEDALASLAEPEREVLMARYWDEMSTAEMAHLLGVSASAVWVRLHRARQAFRHSYAKIMGGDRAVD
jgi:RNA polymerase sigma-70 factor (ECF subfamily)